MPPRRRSPKTDVLTPEDLESLAAAVAAGRRATVYLIEATPSLGLPEGTSAKVVSVDGNTVTISPKGVNGETVYRVRLASAGAVKFSVTGTDELISKTIARAVLRVVPIGPCGTS